MALGADKVNPPIHLIENEIKVSVAFLYIVDNEA